MKNEIITIFKLMKLIRKGKAPKKIKYKNIIYYLTEDIEYRDRISSNLLLDIYGNTCSILDFLNDTVEILSEENDEWEDIEEIKHKNKKIYNEKTNSYNTLNSKDKNIYIPILNQLIKNQKYLKEKLESKDD